MDDIYVAARFAQLSNDDLLAVVGPDREDYEERAIELARIELRRRGVDSTSFRSPDPAAPAASAERAQARLGVRWLEIYAALLGTAAIGGVVVQVVVGAEVAGILMVQLPLSALQGALAYGLLKRRLWAWYLNWAFLLLLLLLPAFLRRAAAILGPLPLVVLNSIYFAKRRQLFGSGKT
ncbi:hypothetical protein WME89_31375 [Sorangium sp. So ce321]|uniref:hypothetical protein n=1 Tax=Sorangium sp. So ce321 TaxID=3133300 RepID=UPI003F619A4A